MPEDDDCAVLRRAAGFWGIPGLPGGLFTNVETRGGSWKAYERVWRVVEGCGLLWGVVVGCVGFRRIVELVRVPEDKHLRGGGAGL